MPAPVFLELNAMIIQRTLAKNIDAFVPRELLEPTGHLYPVSLR